MTLAGVRLGFALTGSHCTIPEVLPFLQQLKDEGAEITPIFSPAVVETDSRFGKAKDVMQKVVDITGREPLLRIVEVEPAGPQRLYDAVVVAPCTGNTLAKLANGISDTNVTMVCKAQLRNNSPVILAISTNDGLSGNARNIGLLLNRRYIYFVPFGQDAPQTKQASLIAKMDLLSATILASLEGRQLQPVLIEYKK